MEILKNSIKRLSSSTDNFPCNGESVKSDGKTSEDGITPNSEIPSEVTDSEGVDNDFHTFTNINYNKHCREGIPDKSSDSSFDTFTEFSAVLKTATSESLMEEVMKEVEKISEDSGKTTIPSVVESKNDISTVQQLAKSSQLLQEVKQDSKLTVVKSEQGNIVYSQSTKDIKMDSSVGSNVSANLLATTQAESVTSGYFSDSVSDEVQIRRKQRKERSKTLSPIPKLFKFGKDNKHKDNRSTTKVSIDETESKQVTKRESIYSRIIKSTKRDGSVVRSTKEPLYARIKPKIFGESSFKPINQNRPTGSKTTVIRPEPVHPTNLTVESSNAKADVIVPHLPTTTKLSMPITTETVLKCDDNVDSNGSSHITQRPLPSLPKELSFDDYTYINEQKDCSKFIVTSRQILPSKPNIITISNPGYAKSNIGMDNILQVQTATPESLDLPNESRLTSNDMSCRQNIASGLFTEEYNNLQDSGISDLQTDIFEKSKLSKLVDELVQELESVSRRTGLHDSVDEDSKRDVLMKLLSNYDLPNSGRPVKSSSDPFTVDESCIPTSITPNELRYVDDNDDEIIYGDTPNYSQDEFFIALDDMNDPQYATLTRDLQKYREEDSSDKISHRSTQVYVNVVNVLSALRVLINSNSTKAATVISKMGTLARPYTHRVHNTINDTSWIQRKLFHRTGHHGFDELRRYIKSGGEFCKELAVIMHERAELETSYAKGLHKLSTKLLKASRDSLGTINDAWQAVGSEFEHEGDAHRILAASLTDEVVRPLRQIIEAQHKVRKGVEGIVDKSTKILQDWRTAEVKAKKTSFHNARESEKVQDMLIDARLNRGKAVSEKDIFKLEKQRKKAEDSVKKSDMEYYNFCVRAERSRQDWESAIYKGSNCFQTLEEERLASLKDLVKKYHKTRLDCTPKMVVNAERLEEPVAACDVEKDIQMIIAAKGAGENVPEQNLPDFYAEDFNNPMNKTRRRDSLHKFIGYLRSDLDRERKGKQGVENLAKALQETPKFGGEDSKQDVNDKLQHMKAMLAYLEASRYKVQSSLEELDSRPRSMHPLAKHIDVRRDKQGYPASILKFPVWEKGGSTNVSPLSESPDSSPNWNDRGTADGNSVQPDSDFVDGKNKKENNFELTVKPMPATQPKAFMYPYRYPSINLPTDEFSSQGSDHDYQNAINEVVVETALPNSDSGGEHPQSYCGSPVENMPDGTYYARPLTIPSSPRCKALYDYEANLYDELTIRTGDIINIHEKQPDGWWLGELEGVVGIFPATYVEDIEYP